MLVNRKYRCDFCNRILYSKFVFKPFKCKNCNIGIIKEIKVGGGY